jgi:hypothetical protein
MEHRWSGRRMCQRTVIIESPLKGPVSAMTRDIGPDGIFVEIAGQPLHVNEPVCVALNLQDDTYSEDFRLEAMVVRHDRDGVALMFLDTPPDLMVNLQRSLNPVRPLNVEQNRKRAAPPPQPERHVAFASNY